MEKPVRSASARSGACAKAASVLVRWLRGGPPSQEQLLQALASAKRALGERMYAAGIDDGERGAKIAAIDLAMRSARNAGLSQHALSLERERLLRELAESALEDDAPLLGADAEYDRARGCRAALEGNGRASDAVPARGEVAPTT